jgi:phage-related protein
MGDVLGTNAAESAALATAIEGVGGNVEAITSQMTFMTRGLVDAEGKLGPVGKTLEGLGVSFVDAQGKMLPTTEILTAVADKLAVMPDGLEKTALMTEVFGKSGKDLTDVMNALANGGLAAAGEKAEALGLVLGDDMVGAVVESGKQVATLKQAARGLFVTLGAELLPILAPLLLQFTTWAVGVMPMVRAGIANVVNWIMGVLIPALVSLVAFLQPVVQFLVDNWQPIFAAVVAFVLGFVVPALVTWATTAATTAAATIAALAPVVLPILAIAAAVGLLFAAWENDWGGIRTTLTAVWEGSLRPALADLWNWLSVNVPAAIQVLSDFWTGTLLPAINAVWAFGQDYLVPLWEAVADLFNAALTLAITALAGLWSATLQPALETVADYVSETLQPVFEDLEAFWTGTLGPALETVKTSVLDKLAGVFTGIKDAIGWVIEKLTALTDGLNKVKLPDWMTPGSPTPWEIGLRGVAGALDELSRAELPEFGVRARAVGMAMPEGALTGGDTTINHTYYLTGNYRYESEETLSEQVRKMELLHG